MQGGRWDELTNQRGQKVQRMGWDRQTQREGLAGRSGTICRAATGRSG